MKKIADQHQITIYMYDFQPLDSTQDVDMGGLPLVVYRPCEQFDLQYDEEFYTMDTYKIKV